MDRRQAKKVAYLIAADILEDVGNGNDSLNIEDFYSDYGITEKEDEDRVKRALSGIGISARNTGSTMTATGGGGTRFAFGRMNQAVNQPQTQGVSTVTNSTPSTVNTYRLPVSDAQLEMLVAVQLEELTRANESFTAWDITNALRAAHPTLTLFHSSIRPIVHDLMIGNLSTYSSTGKDFGNGVAALEYFPTPASTPTQTPVSTPTISGGGLTSLLLGN